MVTRTETKCDVIGCGEDAYHSVDCCMGWEVSSGDETYKKFEKPLKERKADLCEKHWKEWAILTCKLLKMYQEDKE